MEPNKPYESIPLEGTLSLRIYRASTGNPDHAVFRLADPTGDEHTLDQFAVVLARAIVRLNNELCEAWHVAAQNERNRNHEERWT